MEPYIIFFFLVLIGLNCWISWRFRPINTVIAGTTKYMPGCPHPLRHDAKFENVSRSNVLFARAAEDGELWSKGDVLIINKWINDFTKGQFYLFEYEKGEYRIAKCIGSSRGFPPIFDGHETFITHEPHGVVVGCWDMLTNSHTYFDVKP